MPWADAVEWKRLVPGVEARDSLVGLGLLAAWHIFFWVWGIPITQYFEVDGPGSIWPDEEQLGALMANAAIAGAITQQHPFCLLGEGWLCLQRRSTSASLSWPSCRR